MSRFSKINSIIGIACVLLFSSSLYAQEDLNVTLAGRWANGPCEAVLEKDGILFYGNGGFLEIVDVSSLPNFTDLSKILVPGSAKAIHIEGNHAYIASSVGELRIIDISDLANPVEVGFFVGGFGSCNDVYIYGDYAFIAYCTSLVLIDISDPTAPFYIKTFSYTQGGSSGLFGRNNYLYVTASTDGLVILDINDPINPVLLSNVKPSTQSIYYSTAFLNKTIVKDNYAYLATNYDGLVIYDVSDPANPDSVWSSPTFWDWTLDIKIEDNYAFVACRLEGLRILDISDPANPVQIGSYDTNGEAYSVSISNQYAFIADNQLGLKIIDVSDKSNPTLVESIFTGGFAEKVTIEGSYAFVPSGFAGLMIIDISDPSNPESVASYINGSTSRIAITDHYAYVIDEDIDILDISNPSDPTKISEIDDYPYNSYDLYIEGNFLFITGGQYGQYNYLKIYNIEDRSNPVEVGIYESPDYLDMVEVHDDIAYVSKDILGIELIDISDPANPVKLSEFSTGSQITKFCIKDSTIYLSDTYNGLIILDTSDPGSPSQIGSCPTDSYLRGVDVWGNYAFLADGFAGLMVLNISDPGNPSLLSRYATDYDAFDILYHNNYVYLADGRDGLYIFNTFVEKKGDVNQDGLANIFDLNEVIHYVLFNEPQDPTAFTIAVADLYPSVIFPNTTGPWTLNIFDVVEIIQEILGLNKVSAQSLVSAGQNISEITVGFDGIRKENDIAYYPLRISGGADIAGFEMHLEFDPDNMTFLEPVKTASTKNMSLSFSVRDNTVTLLAYSPDGGAIPACDEIVLELPFRFSGNIDYSSVKFESVLAAGKHVPELTVTISSEITLVEEENVLPEKFILKQNYPNPFNPETTIEYHIANPDMVTLKVYNVLGQEIKTVVNETHSPGIFRVRWDGTNNSGLPVSGGIYIYHLKTANFSEIRKMLLLK
ncbi:FlgD immunoglobulin-like domain containing protein [candidate division KSB1 bacterium]